MVPLPTTVAVRSSRSSTTAVCSSTPRTNASGGNGLHQRQPVLAEVAEAGVVVAALGVVVVRDDRPRAAR